jgi:1,4-dihydroxy-2-naphthoate octaprenyltransferase
MSWISRWLVMTRAVVLVMTLNSAIAGALLAMTVADLDWPVLLILLLGLSLAHATNNLVNDWTDYFLKIDQQNQFRRRYGTHVLIDGLVSQPVFFAITLATALSALLCGLFLFARVGDTVLYLMLAGTFFVLFYTWPLKHLALGELAVFLVWGPLITGGSFLVIAASSDTGALPAMILLFSLMTGMGPTLVIFGKHMDKAESDAKLGVRTLPVLLGEEASRRICQLLIIIHWMLTAYILFRYEAWYLLPAAVALPAAFRLFRQLGTERPTDRPEQFPHAVWPLWFSAGAFRYARLFGAGLLTGLLINLFLA